MDFLLFEFEKRISILKFPFNVSAGNLNFPFIDPKSLVIKAKLSIVSLFAFFRKAIKSTFGRTLPPVAFRSCKIALKNTS